MLWRVMEWQPWRLEPFLSTLAQIVKMQTSLSSLISTSHLFSLRTDDFLLILLLAKTTCRVIYWVHNFFSWRLMAERALPVLLVYLSCFQTVLKLTNTLTRYSCSSSMTLEILIINSQLLSVYLRCKQKLLAIKLLLHKKKRKKGVSGCLSR